jgi:putative flippase GtrA
MSGRWPDASRVGRARDARRRGKGASRSGPTPCLTSVEGVMATHCGSVHGVTPDRADGRNIREFLRYAAVGGAQNGLNLLAFAGAVLAGVPYLLAALIAAVAALSFSFVLNHLWTFPNAESHVPTRAIRFAIVWVAIVALTLLTLAVLVDVAHLPRVLAQAIAILFGAPLSYAAQRRWTFGYGSYSAANEPPAGGERG